MNSMLLLLAGSCSGMARGNALARLGMQATRPIRSGGVLAAAGNGAATARRGWSESIADADDEHSDCVFPACVHPR